jgi:hypothetical protein
MPMQIPARRSSASMTGWYYIPAPQRQTKQQMVVVFFHDRSSGQLINATAFNDVADVAHQQSLIQHYSLVNLFIVVASSRDRPPRCSQNATFKHIPACYLEMLSRQPSHRYQPANSSKSLSLAEQAPGVLNAQSRPDLQPADGSSTKSPNEYRNASKARHQNRSGKERDYSKERVPDRVPYLEISSVQPDTTGSQVCLHQHRVLEPFIYSERPQPITTNIFRKLTGIPENAPA